MEFFINIKNRLARHEWLVWLAFLLLTFILYASTWHCGFVTDYTGFQERISADDQWWSAFKSFGFPAFQPVLNLVLYGLYKVFGVGSPGYFVVYCLIHALNGFLLYLLIRRWFTQDARNFGIAMTAAFFFIVQPYAVEALVWKVVINALLSTSFLFLGIYFLTNYFERSRGLWGFFVFQALSLMTFEYGVVAPFFFVLIGLKYDKFKKIADFLPLSISFGLVLGYFLMVKWQTGDWAGHMGADTHFNLDLKLILGNVFRFLMKYIFFLRFAGFDVKSTVFESWAQSNLIIGSVLLGILGLTTALIWSWWKNRVGDRSIIWTIGMSLAGILPVLTMYFVWLHFSENDRHGYLASGFFYLLVSQLLFRIPFSAWRRGAILSYALILLFFQQKLCQMWRASDEVYWSLIQDFRWYDADQVYVISIPDHFGGIYMFRYCGEAGSGLYDALRFSGGKAPKGRIIEISQYNMNAASEGLSASSITKDSIQGEFLQWGNWWHRKCQGAGSYENDWVATKFDGQFVRSKLKNRTENSVIIHQVGGKWFELK